MHRIAPPLLLACAVACTPGAGPSTARAVEFTRPVNATGNPDEIRKIRTRLVLGRTGSRCGPRGGEPPAHRLGHSERRDYFSAHP